MNGSKPSMFHDGHRTLQDRYDGRRLADALETHRRLETFGPEEVAFIQSAEFFFLATAHGDSVDCSFKGGPKGFVTVTGPTALEWQDLDGNSMYRSLGNILKSGRAGLLFIRMDGAQERLRVNGRAEVLHDHPRLADYPGAKMMVRLEADEIFPNCPRYIPDLAGAAPSEFLPEKGAPLKKPYWKDFPFIRGILSKSDPHK